MFLVYIASLVFGGILVLFSALGSSGEESSGEASDFDSDSDLSAEAEIDELSEASPGSDLPAGIKASTKQKIKIRIFSLRTLMYFCVSFGASGVLLGFLSLSKLEIFLFSLSTGLIAVFLILLIYRYLVLNQSGELTDRKTYLGLTGRVVVPFSKDKKGKIHLNIENESLSLTALGAPYSRESSFGLNAEVIVVECGTQENLVYVLSSQEFMESVKN